MSDKQESSISPNTSTKKVNDLSLIYPRPDLALPDDIKNFLFQLFSDCNRKISYQFCTFPNAHEESLDLIFISHFASMQGAIKFGSHWTLKIDAHFIGGGRHYRTWEVADIGLMVMFRKNGKITRSKLTFLQSKKLYASTLKYKPSDPYHRSGLGRLLVTEEEHRDLVEPKTINFSENSKYKAIKSNNDQHIAMSEFSIENKITLHYLLYNPSIIPWTIKSPIEELPYENKNLVGCRVIPKPIMDNMLIDKNNDYSPSYKDVKEKFKLDQSNRESNAGWRMEDFICDLFIQGEEGLVDDSPNFETMLSIMSRKTSPIWCLGYIGTENNAKAAAL
ncbi:hypothetical protein C1752_13141 [Acaryochloris thomasi RCC1774]|uniref:Uncharacterized protein n=1 Tax=Acaryochloris thomasi RCC1774 TaxID=1764569 RepID=A0A2W1JFC5_9CYAN|nr:hypothetical protein [Acaryochloris thomasi]PZD70415.1 hypothetical protein C1752_13141 [Acaryochloris thomasi RCC1774]